MCTPAGTQAVSREGCAQSRALASTLASEALDYTVDVHRQSLHCGVHGNLSGRDGASAHSCSAAWYHALPEPPGPKAQGSIGPAAPDTCPSGGTESLLGYGEHPSIAGLCEPLGPSQAPREIASPVAEPRMQGPARYVYKKNPFVSTSASV